MGERMATAREAAERLTISERHFFRLVNEGLLPKRGPDGWDLEVCRRRFLDYLVAVALVRGVPPDELGIDERRALRVVRSLALHRGVAPEELGLDAGARPWEL